MITDRDIAVRCVAEGHVSGCRVSDHMTGAPLQAVRPESDQRDVIDRMEKAQVRRIPVVDENNRLLGIIAQADLAMKVGPQRPELVEEVLQAVSRPAILVS
jgi:CBS domain-containing protein